MLVYHNLELYLQRLNLNFVESGSGKGFGQSFYVEPKEENNDRIGLRSPCINFYP